MSEFPYLSKYVHPRSGMDLRSIIKSFVDEEDITVIRSLDAVPDTILTIMSEFPSIDEREIRCILIFFLKERMENGEGENIITNKLLPEGEYTNIMNNILKLSETEKKKIGVDDELNKRYNTVIKKKVIGNFDTTPFEIDNGSIHVKFNEITPVEIFEEMVVNWNVPICLLRWKGRDVVKLYSGMDTDKRWVDMISQLASDRDEVIMAFVIINVPSGEKYSTRAHDNLTYGTIRQQGNGYILTYDFETRYGINEDKINRIIDFTFPSPILQTKQKVIETVSGHVNFKKLPFDKFTFSDFIFRDQIMTKLMFFDERANSAANKKRYHMYIFKNFGNVYDAKAGIMTTMIKKYTDVEVRLKNVTKMEVEKYITLLNKIFVIYSHERDDIEKDYVKEIGTTIDEFTGEKLTVGAYDNKKEGPRMKEMKRIMSANPGRTYNDLFNQTKGERLRGWSVNCAPEKHPYILTDENREEFENAKEEFLNEMKQDGATAKDINAAAGVLTRDWNGYDFACIPRVTDKEQPHVAVRFIKDTEEPCCSSVSVALKEGGGQRKFNPQALAVNKRLDFGRMGITKPHEIDRMFHLIHTNHEWYARYHLGTTHDTFLRCVVAATNTSEYVKYDQVQFAEHILAHKNEIGIQDMDYVHPDTWVSVLSNKFRVNIIIFDMTTDNLHCTTYIPPSYPKFDVSRPCIMMTMKDDADGDMKICELIVKVGNVPGCVYEVGSDMWKLLRDLMSYSSKKYIVA